MSLSLSMKESSSLATMRPNLMPFHIQHDGPAPLSTYFLIKDRTTDPIQTGAVMNDASIALQHARGTPDPLRAEPRNAFTSSFRGREMHGLQVPLPPKYAGILFTSGSTEPNYESSSKFFPMNDKKRKIGELPWKADKRAKGSAPRGLRRTRSMTAAESGQGEEDDVYALMSMPEAATEEKPLSEENEKPGRPVARELSTIGTFSSFVLWHPDSLVDEGRDEYLRAMDEWTRLADVIHQM